MSADTLEFFDVTRRLEEPFANLTMGESRLYAVVGGPSAGKTTLLKQLTAKLEQEGGEPLVVPVLINLDEHPLTFFQSVDGALEWLLVQLLDRLKQPPYSLCALLDRVLKLYDRGAHKPIDSFSEVFSYMRTTAVTHLGEVRMIALIDNVDELAELPIARDLFNSFHALFKDTRIKGFFDLILAGGDNLYDRLTEPDAIWLNDANILPLACLEPMEANALLSARTGGQLRSHIRLLIYAYSGGHPFLLQHFIHELKDVNEDEWDTVTSDIVLDIVDDFLDHDAQRQVDIWRVPDRDESQISHTAYRLLIENRPDPATVAADLDKQATSDLPERLTDLTAAFDTSDKPKTDSLASLAVLLDTVLAEIDHSSARETDWSARLLTLHRELPALYNLLACSFSNMRRPDFRRALGPTSNLGYSYKRALDRLIYMGAIQLSRRKCYIIQGQIFLDQFQEFSTKGKHPFIKFVRDEIEQYEQSLSLLRKRAAKYGGEVYAPLEVQNQIKEIEKRLEEAREKLGRLEKE